MAQLETTPIADGVAITKVGIGTAPIGGLLEAVDSQQGINALQHAQTLGVNYLDSALLYGGGEALKVLGVALGDPPKPGTVVSFKVGRVLTDKDAPGVSHDDFYTNDPHFIYDYSRAGVNKAFKQSMAKLNESRVVQGMSVLKPEDLNIVVYVHDPDVGTHGDRQPAIMEQVKREAFAELHDMQKKGFIKAYGIGTNEVGRAIEALDDPHIKLLMLAGRGTLMCNGAAAAPEPIKQDAAGLDILLKKLKNHPNAPKLVIAAIGNSGLAYGQGTYNYHPITQEMINFRNDIDAVREAYNQQHGTQISMTDLLVQYPRAFLGDNAVAAVVSGPRTPQQAEEVIVSGQKKVPDALWQALADKNLLNHKFQLGGAIDTGFGPGSKQP